MAYFYISQTYAAYNWDYHAGRAKKHLEVEPLNTLFSQFMDPSAISPTISRWTEAISNWVETDSF